MNKLYDIKRGMPVDEMAKIIDEATIFDKIEFSDISKSTLRSNLDDCLARAKRRDPRILPHMTDVAVQFCWFKNWLHPKLKRAVPRSPYDKRGCSKRVLANDAKQDMLNFYENGQQNFEYTLQDIIKYIEE